MSLATTAAQKIDITGVVSIVVTDIVQAADGSFVRAIRFMGDPDEGQYDPSLVLEVKARAATKAPITIATPAAGF